MANSFFRFKQFTIQQGKCAMKVTTDACLFGAVVAKEISKNKSCRVLDIGTGTGVLSLMVAQENAETTVDAVEIDVVAAGQAKDNVAASPWSKRVNVFQNDILGYESILLYDIIVSNPPFYEQQMASPNAGRKLAHHSSQLSLQRLFEKVVSLLKEDGRFYVLLPFYRAEEAVALAKSRELFVEQQWLIKQTPKHPFFRAIFCFGKSPAAAVQTIEMTIQDKPGQYSQIFLELLQPFYLYL